MVTPDPLDLARWFQELSARTSAEQLHAYRRYSELAQRVARGELDAQAVRDEYIRYLGDQTAHYLRGWADLSLSYYNGLLDLNRGYNEGFLERMHSPSRGRRSANRPINRVELPLSGELGREVQAQFELHNDQTQPMEISFEISEFAAEGGAYFDPLLEIEPSYFVLKPGARREVRLRLALLPERFEAGREYFGRVLIRGYDDLELHLKVSPRSSQAKSRAGRPETKTTKTTEATQGKSTNPRTRKAKP